MKKVFNFSALFLLISFVLIGCGSKDGGNKGGNSSNPAVNEICKAFDQMTNKVKACKSIDDLDNIDFDSLIDDKMNFENIDEKYAYQPLTSEDKAQIEKAFNKFLDATLDKGADLSGGLVSKSDLKEIKDMMKGIISSAINESNNVQELGYNFMQLGELF